MIRFILAKYRDGEIVQWVTCLLFKHRQCGDAERDNPSTMAAETVRSKGSLASQAGPPGKLPASERFS